MLWDALGWLLLLQFSCNRCVTAARNGTEEALGWGLAESIGQKVPKTARPALSYLAAAQGCREGLLRSNDRSIPRIPYNPSRTHATSDTVAMQFRQLIAACRLTSHLCTHTYACTGQLQGSCPCDRSRFVGAGCCTTNIACAVCLGTSCDAAHDTS